MNQVPFTGLSKRAFTEGFLSVMARAGVPTEELAPVAELAWHQKSAGKGTELAELAATMGPAMGGQMFSQFADAGETLDKQRKQRWAQEDELKRLEAERDAARKAQHPMARGRR